ncbi:hypothetical protein F2Q70_00010636 [Brassica cretica]|nr:hypothetical protein F2Q70_00010636 [Brassica cretica]
MYEFLALRWFDFFNGETEDEARRAELWFESALSCAHSPSVPIIKARRSFNEEEDNKVFPVAGTSRRDVTG